MGLVGMVAVVAAACGATDPGVSATQSRLSDGDGQLFPTDTTVAGDDPAPVEPTYDIIPGVVGFGADKPAQPYDGFLTAAFGDSSSSLRSSGQCRPDRSGSPSRI